MNIFDDVFFRQQFVALCESLHHAVFDSVVHHLGVVARADVAHVHEALFASTLWAQRIEDWHRAIDVSFFATDH